eukprot:4068752-Alexandrium_andersonii.AAC.1
MALARRGHLMVRHYMRRVHTTGASGAHVEAASVPCCSSSEHLKRLLMFARRVEAGCSIDGPCADC